MSPEWGSIAWHLSTWITYPFHFVWQLVSVATQVRKKRQKKWKHRLIHLSVLAPEQFPSSPPSSQMRDSVVKKKKAGLIIIGNFLWNLLRELLLLNNMLTSVCLWELLKRGPSLHKNAGQETESLEPFKAQEPLTRLYSIRQTGDLMPAAHACLNRITCC